MGAAQTVSAGERSSTAAKADISPCQGVTHNLGANIKNKADLERAITKQLKVSLPALKDKSITVLHMFACDNWSIFYVTPHVADEFFLFYAGNPLTGRYVTKLMGSELDEKEPKIKDWVLKNAPGIPPKLASCFVRHATRGLH